MSLTFSLLLLHTCLAKLKVISRTSPWSKKQERRTILLILLASCIRTLACPCPLLPLLFVSNLQGTLLPFSYQLIIVVLKKFYPWDCFGRRWWGRGWPRRRRRQSRPLFCFKLLDALFGSILRPMCLSVKGGKQPTYSSQSIIELLLMKLYYC